MAGQLNGVDVKSILLFWGVGSCAGLRRDCGGARHSEQNIVKPEEQH